MSTNTPPSQPQHQNNLQHKIKHITRTQSTIDHVQTTAKITTAATAHQRSLVARQRCPHRGLRSFHPEIYTRPPSVFRHGRCVVHMHRATTGQIKKKNYKLITTLPPPQIAACEKKQPRKKPYRSNPGCRKMCWRCP